MIKILTGRQTDPLQEKILEEAVENYQQHPEQETFIIVPNHIKFTTEVRAINKLATSKQQTETAVKNLHVLSFSRLAWFFLKDAEQGLPNQLDDAASAMLLAHIIENKKDELTIFENVNVNSGLVNQLYQTILQVYDGNLDLDEISEDNLDQETKNKLHDLRIIYDAFIKEIAGKFSTKNEVQLQLNEIIAKSKNLKQASFYFCDFSHFSLQETLTIKILMRKAKDVILAFKTRLGEINSSAEEGDYDYVIQQTIKRLTLFLQERKMDYVTATFPLNSQSNGREILNSLWTETIPKVDELKQVQLVKADSRYAEAYFVARTIYQQVALSNYRYHDFLILAPNLKEYETYLTPILRQNQIPFFNDLQQEMKYHPLVVLIESLFNLHENPFQTQNMLAILKTHLLIPSWYKEEAEYIHDVDELENFVLAHGINHNLWKKHFDNFVNAEVIRLDKMDDEVAKIDRLRSYLVDKISTFFKIIEQEKDSQKALTIFFEFLTKNGIADRLEKWRDEANEAGDLQQAQQPEQLWDLLMQLLQDYLAINPETFDLNEFFNMLISAFREANFSQIPSTLDAVNLSEMGMVQTSGYKQVFIIGATASNLPQIQKMPGFLTTENLNQLQNSFNSESYLEDSQQLNNLDQNYQFGLSLALAQDRVYVSYPVLNASNEELDPSIYYQRLKDCGAQQFVQHDLPEKMQDLLSFITNPDASLGYLTYMNSINSGLAVQELLKITQEQLPQKTKTVLEASDFDNQPENIGQDLASQLYGQNLNSSVSQLETFYENSYEYFLNYGLKLRRRFENEFDVIQAGNYFHETFDRLVKKLNKQHTDLADLSSIELEQMLNSVRNVMKDEGKYSQLMNDPFNQYLFKCLDHTTSKVAHNWRRSLKETPLRAKYSELSFGLGEKIKGLSLEVPDISGQHKVDLRGKMDRVDLANFNDKDQVLAQVIDYKSSAKKFDLGMFYNGIALQMVSYLDVLTKNDQFFAGKDRLSLLGAFYQTVTRQLERLNSNKLIDSSLNLKKGATDSKPKLMYTGLISNDPEILVEAEPLLDDHPSYSSELYTGVKTKARGGFSLPRDRNFSEEEIELLLEYDEYLIRQASSQILSGKIELNPYRYGKAKNSLTYSDYRDVFFFDAMLRQNQYHEINNLNKKELILKIKEKLGKEQ
ncbi:ATP-dependent helicase/nuclease RexB [Lactobacillus crispatus]|uniref:ATP-dependent helicase/deoxyribonuclease subunit B n=1 Tax=Lactobacillus crispatus TaxID=47770 RepID=A0A7H9E9S1_9LACO|nr:ATP-dependent helicase/nuclease RexB [Lactobacillus crispatus]QLL73925.1 ATP-dependent helicase/nuclease RexB [Lactobacillus crispatus]